MNAEPNWLNRTLFHGDNLPSLRAMNSGSVHLIATDPPFKKGRDFHATPDSLASGASFQDRWSWTKDVHEEWIDKITDDFPRVMNVVEGSGNAYGDDLGAYLCFMAVRLLEMRRVLRDDGAMFLHCDPTASHYLKELMDIVFGRRNFVNEIIWSYRSGGGSKRHFGRKHDVIFFYSANPGKHTFNSDAVRVPYSAAIAKSRKHMFHPKGKVSGDVWDIARPPNHSPEWTGWPTQKPLALYERMILAASSVGDVVLDPFAGCATTCLAAERHGRRWVGIDIWRNARDVILKRMEKEGIVDEGTGRRGKPLLRRDMHFLSRLPRRTDDGRDAVPFMKTKIRTASLEPEGPRMSRKEMLAVLLKRDGMKCRACDRGFDDARYLELDHNTPRSDGGINHVSNRILLCGPCNRAKSNLYTLSGIRRLNRKMGWMAK